jgi:hypothetical protein
MPLVTAQLYIQGLINGLVIPGPANTGVLQAFITPPDPNFDSAPAAYIWPSKGDEHRQSVPRNIGPGTRAGWKTVDQQFDIWLAWFGEDTDPQADIAFPSIVDSVMFTLRTSPDPAPVVDPDTGAVSWMVGVGERMSWDFAGVRSVADQRYLRYSALVHVPFSEFIQA